MATTPKTKGVSKRAETDANVRIPSDSHRRLALALKLRNEGDTIREKVAELADAWSMPVLKRHGVSV